MSHANITRHLLIALISCCVIFVIDNPSWASVGPPPKLFSKAEIALIAYKGEAGISALNSLKEIQDHYEHYLKQAKYYDSVMLAIKIAISLFGLVSAIILALSKAEWSRKTALVLSILVATIPATDQIFQVNELRQVSWRTAVNISRLYSECKGRWETNSYQVPVKERLSAAHILFPRCKVTLDKYVDKEMEISLKPLEVPVPTY
jgi:hypothetical protein